MTLPIAEPWQSAACLLQFVLETSGADRGRVGEWDQNCDPNIAGSSATAELRQHN